MKFAKIHLISTFLLCIACQPLQWRPVDSEAQATQATRSPLRITGFWKATEVWGSTTNNLGERVPTRTKGDKLNPDTWRVSIDVDSEGSGVIRGLLACRGPGEATSTPSRIREQSELNSLFGVLNILRLIERTMNEVECATSANATMGSFVIVSPSKTFFGQPDPHVAKNLGVFGEAENINAVENECRRLRGARFVSVAKASACVGFTDASANNIRFLIVPAGEIYALRVNMKRD